MALSPCFRPVRFDDIPGWREQDHSVAYAAFRRSALQVPYKTGALGVEASAFAAAQTEARNSETTGSEGARAFFEQHFVPALIDSEGFVTGFYEPEAVASPVRSQRFTVPLLARPADLVDVDDSNRPSGMDPYFAFGRKTEDGIVEYHDRRTISDGALADRGLEIAWLESKIDAFFIHVQGAARLRMTDGQIRRVTYSAKTGHRFTGIGRELADMGEIPLADVTMQSIRAWLAAHPKRVDEILSRNRSYIFFRETPSGDPLLGPVAAAKVQLTAGASVAVDRLLHTFGTPLFIDAPAVVAFDAKPFRRLMIAQDTGSAIIGQARGDLFAGTGDAAGEIAGVIRHPATFYALLPKPVVEIAQ